ncbi:MAG: ATP-binding protein, partial [Methanomassiliicoccales archaeon]|nr:ATP-binding protein [Methanomassiliicoccales archaeon]
MSGPAGEGERVGRIFGERVMEIRFRAPSHVGLQVGEMLMVEEDAGDRYLVRVMDVEHGADLDSPDQMRRLAGELITKDLDEEEIDRGGLYANLYKVGVCAPLGHVQGTEFKKAKSVPAHFSTVRRTSASDYQFLRSYLGDVEVGRLRSGDRVLEMPVGFWGRSMPYHIGIFATTGMGKSNLMKGIALSCLRLRRYGFLILDPHGEYYDGGEAGRKGLRDVIAPGGLEVFSSRRLDGPYNPLKVSATEIEIDDLANLYEFTSAQLECLQAAQWRYGQSYLLDLHRKDPETVSQDLSGRFHEGSINVIKRRLENIFRFELITTDPQYSITSRVISSLHSGKVVLIDTSNMFEAEELLVSTVLARAVFERNKSLYSDK